MNAVFFHDSRLRKCDNLYYTSGGLTNRYLQRYLKFFSKLTLCTREEEISKQENIEKFSISSGDKIEFKCIKSLKLISLLLGKDKEKIKENIRDNDFAIIRLPSFIGLIACKEARKYKKNYLIEMVACPWDALWNYGKISKKIVAPIYTILNKYEVKRAQNVIYVSNEFLQKRYPTNGKYIGCSDVDIQCTKKENLEKRIKKISIKENCKNEIYKLGIIGSLNVNFKGHKTAIQALGKIKDSIRFELHFLGTGNKEKWIKMAKKHGIEKNLFFDGVLPHEKVNKWLDGIDIYLIPSLQEGLPRALIEAMSRACPAIGTDVGGIPELLDKEMLIRKNDYNQLARKILELVNDKEKMKTIAQKNFNKSLKYRKDSLDNKREEFYREILK